MLQLCLKRGTQPICQKFRDLNLRQEAELEKQLNTWLQEGVIEPSTCAHKKKDRSTPGAVDYRALYCCQELCYPLL